MDIFLLTRRLILRTLRLSDAEAMFGYRSRPDVSRYQIWQPVDVLEIRKFIKKQKKTALDTPNTWFSLAIALRENDEMIGDIGFHFPENERTQAEIGISLSPAFQKRGFAAEALEAACRYLFQSMGKDCVYASVDPRNTPSIRLLEQAGMRKEAFFPGRMVIRGELVDDAVYAIRKDEFQNKKI
jgi:RimJ/RimL family protein N-acetyltransferase